MARLNTLVDVKIACIIFIVTVIISIVLCSFIILLIVFTKNLHSPANLLICNTCSATIFYCIMATIQIYCFYMESDLTDWWCRILAYLNYVFLYMITYSFVIQALSRSLYIFLHGHRYLLYYKSHIIFIMCQIFLSFLVPLPSLITKDIVFRPSHICLIPTSKILHSFCFLVSSYFVPLFIIITMYSAIYYRVIKSSIIIQHSSHITKRDLELIRNILILFVIFLLAGIPRLIYTIMSFKTDLTTKKSLYMLPVVAASTAIVIEKICLIFINRKIRKETKRLLSDLHIIHISTHAIIHPSSGT